MEKKTNRIFNMFVEDSVAPGNSIVKSTCVVVFLYFLFSSISI